MAEVALSREEVFKKVGYNPHPSQQTIHDSTARFKVPTCGRRYGKSRSAAAEAISNQTYNLLMPNITGWIVGPKYIHGAKEFSYLWEFFIKKLKLGNRKDVRKAFNIKQGNMFIELPWGSRIDVLSAERKDTLVGEGLHFLLMVEAAKHDDDIWDQYLQASLADHLGWMIAPSTPEGYNWYHDLHQLGDVTSIKFDKEWESWNKPSWENPYVYPGGREDPEILRQEKSMPEDVFWQEIGAQFRSVVGLVYPEFDETVHVIDSWEYRPDWPNYLFMDFGFRNPMAVYDVQVSPRDDVFVWREHYVAKETLAWHVHTLKARSNPKGYSVVCGFGDSADPEACEYISQHITPIYSDNRAKDWTRGVAEVKTFLKGEDEKPHAFFSKECPNIIWEFQNHRLKKTNRSDQNPAESAESWADHGLDGFRYFLMHKYVLAMGRYHVGDVIDEDTIQRYIPEEERGIFTMDRSESLSLDKLSGKF